MTTLTEIVSVGDRLHAINQTITGVNAKRYWPTTYGNSALWPFVVPLPGRRTTAQNPRAGAEAQQKTRIWNLLIIVGAMTAGIPSESAQRNGESLLELLMDAYDTLPRLELNDEPLGIVVSSVCLTDNGIEPYPQATDLASIILPLQVTTRRRVPFQTRSL